jgi:nucleotide-binding universal stress UspA family protein
MRILLAVDLEDEPEVLIERAVSFVSRLGATLHLAYADEFSAMARASGNPWLDAPLHREWQRMIDEDRAELAKLLEKIPAAHRGTSHLLDGPPAATIATHAAEYHLVLVGTHGRKGLAHLWLGSVAEKIVRHAPVPVLVMRERPLPEHPRVLVALDPVGPIAPIVEQVAPWAERFGATVDLVSVLGDPAAVPGVRDPMLFQALADARDHAVVACRDRLHTVMTKLPEPSRGGVKVDIGAPSERVIAALEGHDLVVAATHGRTGMAHFVLGSVAERIVRTAPTSVLLLPIGVAAEMAA